MFITLLIVASGIRLPKKEVTPSVEQQILGSWLVTSQYFPDNDFTHEDTRGVSTEWGCHYIVSLQLNADHSYEVNLPFGKSVGDKAGTWIFKANEKQIIFTCQSDPNDPSSSKYSDQFQVSINEEGQLLLQNEHLQLKHNRIQ